jgi:hypothetical protein
MCAKKSFNPKLLSLSESAKKKHVKKPLRLLSIGRPNERTQQNDRAFMRERKSDEVKKRKLKDCPILVLEY